MADGLAFNTCARKLSAWDTCFSLGAFSREASTWTDTAQLAGMANSAQVVCSLDNLTLGRISHFFVYRGRLLSKQARLASRITAVRRATNIAIWPLVGRNSLESLCIKESSVALFTTNVSSYRWGLLGGLAYSIMVSYSKLCDDYATADHVHQPDCVVCHICVFV